MCSVLVAFAGCTSDSSSEAEFGRSFVEPKEELVGLNEDMACYVGYDTDKAYMKMVMKFGEFDMDLKTIVRVDGAVLITSVETQAYNLQDQSSSAKARICDWMEETLEEDLPRAECSDLRVAGTVKRTPVLEERALVEYVGFTEIIADDFRKSCMDQLGLEYEFANDMDDEL